MAHSRINQNALFDWIERNLAADQSAPGDDEIVERFGFTSREQARTLLADLADQGRIAINWNDDGRTVTLGRKGGGGFTPARPLVASVVKRDERGARLKVDAGAVLARPFDPNAGIAAARAATARGKAALAIISDPVSPARQSEAAASEGGQPAAEQARVESAPPIISTRPPHLTGSPVDQGDRGNVRDGSKGEAEAKGRSPATASPTLPQAKRLPTAPSRPITRETAPAARDTRRQLNVQMDPNTYAAATARAAAERETLAGWVRGQVATALDDASTTFAPGQKPFISAAVIRAARAAGQPLDVFVTAMIVRGFQAWQADAMRSVA